MPRVIDGRFMARMDEPFDMFLIGMRVNRPRSFRKWFDALVSTRPMLGELRKHPEKGLLGTEVFFFWRG